MNIEQLNKLLFEKANTLSSIASGQANHDALDQVCLDLENTISISNAQCAIFEKIGENFYFIAAPSNKIESLNDIDEVPLSYFGYKPEAPAFFDLKYRSFELESSIQTHSESELNSSSNILHTVGVPIIDDDNTLLGLMVLFSTQELAINRRQVEFLKFFSHFTSAILIAINTARDNELKIEALKKSNEKFRAFTKVMPDLALIIDETGLYEDVHGSPDNLVYISATEIINQNVNDIFPPADAEKIMSVIGAALATDKTQEYEYSIQGDSGVAIFEGRITPIHYNTDESEKAKHVLWMARDVTEAKKTQKKVKQLAYFDPLTQLPNRRMFNERLELTVDSKAMSQEFGAILFLDLDEFKRINDSLGHSAGDKLLKDVSERLRSALRKSDILARIGGDEFVILVENVGKTLEQAQLEISIVAKKVQEAFTTKFEIEELVFQVSCSIGICVIDGTTSAQNIMKFADTAMYNSKRQGGNSYSYYDPQKQTLLDRQLTFESEIVSAIENRQFCAFFQPQVDRYGKLCGAEALIRWLHPDKGMIPPDEFISVAEQFGLIQSLQDIVLEDICQLIKTLEVEAVLPKDFKISINISHSQFKSTNFKRLLMSTINKYNVDASRITLEITESMLSHDISKTVQQMNDIAGTGFTFSIDDFGTGYSNLSNLHAYPVQELKIDKSFVDRLLDSSGLSIVETIISLAKNLEMRVVAEGVEDEKQVAVLKGRDVDILQGYYFSKPLQFEDYVQWHKNNLLAF